jgi:hypothetical protein
MKHTTIILALSLLLAACSRHNTGFTKQIPGIWKQVVMSCTNTLTIVPDGSFSFSRTLASSDMDFTNIGTWLIRNGRIVLTATNQNGAHPLPLGDFFKAEIVHLDEHELDFKMDYGETNSFIQ